MILTVLGSADAVSEPRRCSGLAKTAVVLSLTSSATALVGRGVWSLPEPPPPEPVARHLQAEQARPAREPAKVVEDRYRTCWELHAIEQTRYGRRPHSTKAARRKTRAPAWSARSASGRGGSVATAETRIKPRTRSTSTGPRATFLRSRRRPRSTRPKNPSLNPLEASARSRNRKKWRVSRSPPPNASAVWASPVLLVALYAMHVERAMADPFYEPMCVTRWGLVRRGL